MGIEPTSPAWKAGALPLCYARFNPRPAIQKEALNHIQPAGGKSLEEAETESLSDRRSDAVEDNVGSRGFHPLGAARGEKTAPGLRELGAGVPLRSLQTS